jgi:DNA-binding SARP family transcriptional activator
VIGYRLPGPLEVSVNSRAIEIGGVKQRALLATLLRRANQPVSRDVLVHQLWGEYPPAGAQHSLEVCISRLRKTLEPAAGGRVVLTRPGAYLLPVAADTDRHQPVRASGRGRRRALEANDTVGRRASARRLRSGAGRRSPISASSRSLRSRSRGWTNYGVAQPRIGSN